MNPVKKVISPDSIRPMTEKNAMAQPTARIAFNAKMRFFANSGDIERSFASSTFLEDARYALLMSEED